MTGKRPSFQFYPGDWLRDPAVRSLSPAARGLWIDMLCLMFENDRKGYLSLSGKPVSQEQLARMTGCSSDEVSRLLTELESSGAFSRTEHGMIYSRRMVRDESNREKWRQNGSKGGNPILVNQKVNQTPNQKPTPSSSSSSSSSSSLGGVPPKNPPEKTAKRSRPKARDPTPEFIAFWLQYPRKQAKQDAMDAWNKLAPSPELVTQIMAALAVWKASPAWQDPKYIPHASRWLNARRWEDEVDGPAATLFDAGLQEFLNRHPEGTPDDAR